MPTGEPAQPANTDPELFEKGKHLCTITGPRSFTIEDWVQNVAKRSGQRVDWRQVGGRACVLYLGNRQKVIDAIEATWNDLVDAYMECKFNFVTNAERSHVTIHVVG